MSPFQGLPGISLTNPLGTKLAWSLWGLLLLGCVAAILAGSQRSVTPSYTRGATLWLAGEPLYDGSGSGFIYLPQSAIAFVPFSLMPHHLREISWRILTLGCFAAGVWQFAQLGRREGGVRFFLFMTLICLPLCFSGARNGQATLPLTGLMLLAVVDQCDRKWWRATLWLSLGLAIKPHMIVPILLAGALCSPLRLRLPVGLAAVFGLPFLLQQPDYVISTYVDCLAMLVDADRAGFTGYWADFFGMLRVAGLEVPHMVQTLTRVGAAVGVLGLCWHAHRSQSRVQAHVLQFSLAASYLLLMNPRTENNTYALLAPALAIISSQALLVHKRYVKGSIVLVCAALVISSYEVGRLFVEPGKAIFLAPLGCLALFVVLLREVLPGNSLAPGDVGLELATHRTLPEHARSQCPSFLDRSPS